MQIEYAKELVAVDCERMLETLQTFNCSVELTDEQAAVVKALRQTAQDAVRVFKHPEGSVK